MTLDEAIKHCKDVYNEKFDNTLENIDNMKCSLEHYQLYLWLKELKMYKEKYGELN